jgi:hypothetical protein
MLKHEKVYNDEYELMFRFGIFRANKHQIEAHNKKGLSWTHGLNHFSDMTVKEFETIATGLRGQQSKRTDALEIVIPEGAPAEIDWTTKGAVTPVKN